MYVDTHLNFLLLLKIILIDIEMLITVQSHPANKNDIRHLQAIY